MNEKKVLSFKEAVTFTGLSKSYLYKLTSRRHVPHFKPHGKKIYFDRAQLEAWLLSNPVATADQIEADANRHILKQAK